MSIIEIRPGNGGKDAEDFAKELKESFINALKNSQYRVSSDSFSALNRSYSITTSAPQDVLAWLSGQHVVTRIPRGSSSRHTSSATVVVRDEQQVQKIEIKQSDIRIDRYRGSGPGGQHRNKTSSSVRLVHYPTGIIITRESGRSQHENLRSAMDELSEKLSSLAHSSQEDAVANSRKSLDDHERAFTHNYQRGEVIHHETGNRWNLRNWQKGKFSLASK